MKLSWRREKNISSAISNIASPKLPMVDAAYYFTANPVKGRR